MRRSARGHYVSHNKVTRVPRAHIYLDTEAHRAVHGLRELQTFRCAVMAYDTRRHKGDQWKDREWSEWLTLDGLWEWVDARCRPRARTVLVCHNLAYDLRIADAFGRLPALGWRCTFPMISDRGSFFTWKRDGRTLVMVDSMSWVPTSLERLGELVQVAKLPLPDWEDDDDAWLARCRRDVEILATVWRRLVKWVVDDDLGNWKPTGAGQSWAAFRHRFMDYPLLVHEDDDARQAERVAAWTGRCEAWQHGRLRGGPFVEWDYSTAYARIGADSAVPIKLLGELVGADLAAVERATGRCAVLVEAELTTSSPTVPARGPDGIVWPVGTFVTTIWENELRSALDLGATVHVRRAWWYRRAPALRSFCEWVLEQLDPRNVDVDPVVRVALKHWSRALIGRTAAQWSRWSEFGRAPYSDVMLSTVLGPGPGERYRMLHLGTQLIRQGELEENPDALVAVMSWVMAEARVRLWDVMGAAGLGNVAYVDTDSVIVGQAGHERLLSARVPGLVVKGCWQSAEVLGPRQIVLSGRLRAAGVPRDAVKVADDTWEGSVWAGLATSLGSGEAAAVSITSRTFRMTGRDSRRRHNADGTTEPIELGEAESLTG